MGNVDLVQWVISLSGAYTCSFAWNEIRVKHEEVISWKLIWHNPFIPKYSHLLVSYVGQINYQGQTSKMRWLCIGKARACLLCRVGWGLVL